MSKCSYCGQDRSPTREHIWPGSLIAKYDSLKTFNPRKNNFFVGEAVIKDVCAECNNTRLSALDTYLSAIFDNHFRAVIEAGQTATLQYEYDKLLRALLKISFNSSRASGDAKSKALHQKFAKYILYGGYVPRLALRLQIVTSSTAVNLTEGSQHQFRPEALRCATLAYDGPLSRRFLVRLIAFNSYWFYLLLPYKNEPDHKWREFIQHLESWRTPVGVLVSANESKLTIPVNKSTFMHPTLLGSLLHASA